MHFILDIKCPGPVAKTFDCFLFDPTSIGTGPGQRVFLAILVVEELGADRGVEARIAELPAQIPTALVRAFRPGGADFRAADQHTMAERVLDGGAQVGDDHDFQRVIRNRTRAMTDGSAAKTTTPACRR